MRILKVREKSVNFDGNGTVNLKYVMSKRFQKNGYTHIKLGGKVYPGKVSSGITWVISDSPINSSDRTKDGHYNDYS